MPRHRRNRVLAPNVKQNAGVSPKSVDKACHSPCFQNELQKSPLDFLGIPFLPAFSHKELMGHFEAHSGLYRQNDEVSPECTPMCTPRPGVAGDGAACLPPAFCPRRPRAARRRRANGLPVPRGPEVGPGAHVREGDGSDHPLDPGSRGLRGPLRCQNLAREGAGGRRSGGAVKKGGQLAGKQQKARIWPESGHICRCFSLASAAPRSRLVKPAEKLEIAPRNSWKAENRPSRTELLFTGPARPPALSNLNQQIGGNCTLKTVEIA